MESFKIEIPEGYEIDKEKSTFEKIVFKKLANKYPKIVGDIKGRSWYIDGVAQIREEDLHRDINQVSSKERAEAFLALIQLVELRDACNKIDGGKEWNSLNYNFVIEIYGGEIDADSYVKRFKVLHFRKESTRDLFLKEHKELIEQAKELI